MLLMRQCAAVSDRQCSGSDVPSSAYMCSASRLPMLTNTLESRFRIMLGNDLGLLASFVGVLSQSTNVIPKPRTVCTSPALRRLFCAYVPLGTICTCLIIYTNVADVFVCRVLQELKDMLQSPSKK
jgi:hypothetical protein